MSVRWDVKWCPMSRITTPLALKRQFHWISMKSRLVRAARETSKFQKLITFINRRHLNMAEILPIRRNNHFYPVQLVSNYLTINMILNILCLIKDKLYF